MANPAELHLKSDHVRAVGRLDVTADQGSDPNVSLNPTTATVDVGGGEPTESGSVTVRNEAGTTVGTVSADGGAGKVTVTDQGGHPTVELDGTGVQSGQTVRPIEVSRNQEVAAAVETTDAGGRFVLKNTLQSGDAVDIRSTSDGGQISLTRLGGDRTIQLRGDEAALLLDDDQRSGLSAAGGGELVIGEVAGTTDIHVHATGKFTSEYGLDNGNRPRIHLHGPEGTVELGRGEQANGTAGVNGSAVLRDDHGEKLLELQATDDGTSRVVFRYFDGSTSTHRGTIEAQPDGLMFYNSNDQEVLLIANNGEVRTRTAVKETL
jgi:hypothetical protein